MSSTRIWQRLEKIRWQKPIISLPVAFKHGTKFTSLNPLDDLNQQLQVPILPLSSNIFKPLDEEVQQAQDIFDKSSLRQPQLTIHKKGVYLHQLPDTKAVEVAFIGCSNVGKSSLIQAIYKTFPEVLQKTTISKTPGHTTSLQMLELKDFFTLVDMPGYGHNMPQHFMDSVEAYLVQRSNLTRILMLLDADRGILSADAIALDMLREVARPFTIVLTKGDKVHASRLYETVSAILKVIDSHPTAFPQPFLISAHNGAGIAFLRTYIAYCTGCLKLQETSW